MKKNNTLTFLTRAKEIHGNKYDYSKVNYINTNTKVCIVCPEHGEFWQTPHHHLQGQGCYLCGINKLKKKKAYIPKINRRIKKDFFISKAKEIHGDKYDYSKMQYEKATKKVCIVCPEHGEFWQTPSLHMKGSGCPYCAGNTKMSTSFFIEKAKKVHGDKYDYSKVEYVNANTKVCIICKEHGEFWQRPSAHLAGQGCPSCKGHNISLKNRKEEHKFIEDAKKVHGNKYDYSKVEYVNSKTPICIICPEHGEFWQKPSKHLVGHGCPMCKESKLENEIRDFLDKKDINYIAQKTFKWLKCDGPLKLDFYLPEYNVAIECQGEQHFYPVDFAGNGKKWAKEKFEYIKTLDETKRNLCEKNNIKIFYYTTKNVKLIAKNESLITDKEAIIEYAKKYLEVIN